MNKLEAMALLVKVSELGSMSAVSRAHKIPLTSVSRNIAELENSLGVRLLTRSTRRISLTDAGRDYVAAARRILEEVEQAERAATGEYQTPKGELVITAPAMFGRRHVLPLVTEFLEQYPQITVRLLLSDRNDSLIDENIDIAIRIGKLPDSSLIAIPLGSMRTVTCASTQWLARNGTPQTPEQLIHLPCITIEAPMPSTGWRYTVGKDNMQRIVAVHQRLGVTAPEAAVDAAIRHAGLTRVLHYQAQEGLRSGELKLVLEPFETPPVPVTLLHVSRALLPLKLRRFIEFVTPRLRESLNELGSVRGKT